MNILKSILFLLMPVSVLFCQENQRSNFKLRNDFWQQNFTLDTKSDKYFLAEKVFNKLLKVADKPIGVLPRLYVFSELHLGQVLALPDGSIILPQKTIDFCMKQPKYGESRLAFILGHEIKHVVKGDYWLIETLLKFFPDSLDIFDQPKFQAIWNKVHWEQLLESRKAIEIEADEFAILYTSLAGFNVGAILSEKHNFISEYSKAAGFEAEFNRSDRISKKLAEILDYLDLFEFANALYLVDKTDSAIDLFYKFVQRYPSKEAFNNLGMCYYQQAFNAFKKIHRDNLETEPRIVFRLSAGLDPVSGLPFFGPLFKSGNSKEFDEALTKSIISFEEAIGKDETYELALNNLGCAYLLQGKSDFAKGFFKQALDLNPYLKEAYNNLGVAILFEETQTNNKTREALTNFLAAVSIQADYPDAIYNVARLHWQRGQQNEAVRYFKNYLQLQPYTYHAQIAKTIIGQQVIQQPEPIIFKLEKIAEIAANDLFDLDSLQWKSYETVLAKVSVYSDPKKEMNFYRYHSKYYPTIISFIRTNKNFTGFTARGIRIGDPDQLVSERYPVSHSIRKTGNSNFWIYNNLGLVFEIQNKKVRNWYLFSLK